MDAATLRLLFRLSLAIVVLVFSLAAIAAGVELPLGRGGRALPALALLGSVIAILLIIGRLRGRRQPGSPLASLAPVTLTRTGARRLTQAARARFSAQLHRRRRAARVREAERAALAAARDDDRLEPERITKAADALFRLVCLARNARDPKRLATLMSPELLAVWERALDAGSVGGAHERVQVLGDVKVDLVGLTLRSAQAATVIVLIEAELEVSPHRAGKRVADKHGPSPKQMLCQYWTLALGEGPLTVAAIEERHEGDRHLVEPIMVRADDARPGT